MKAYSLHNPVLASSDKKYLNEACKSTWISANGKYINLLEKKINLITSAKYSVACNSGSSGIFISLKAIGIKSNYEVIVPTITFAATINAVVQNNAKPVFMDCDKNFNLNLNKLVQFLSEETYTRNGKTYNKKTDNRVFAVIVVHCFGFPVNLERITSICKKKNILIVEDAAESLGSKFKKGKYKNCHTGSVGDVGIFSFNGNKIITGGGGGIVISNKKKIIEKIRYLINQAKDNPIKFIHNESGYNLRITNLQSAIIYSQLKRLQKILLKKKRFIIIIKIF